MNYNEYNWRQIQLWNRSANSGERKNYSAPNKRISKDNRSANSGQGKWLVLTCHNVRQKFELFFASNNWMCNNISAIQSWHTKMMIIRDTTENEICVFHFQFGHNKDVATTTTDCEPRKIAVTPIWKMNAERKLFIIKYISLNRYWFGVMVPSICRGEHKINLPYWVNFTLWFEKLKKNQSTRGYGLIG